MASVMVAPSIGSLVAPSLAARGNAPRAGVPAGKSPASNPDPRRYRALYPDLWRAFLHAHFRDAMQVGFFFSVSERTSRDWWEGVTTSQGWAVAYAVETIPTAAAYLRAA